MLGATLLSISLASNFMNIAFKTNYDGDTFAVDIKGVPEVFGYDMHVRIRGIDTAEVKSKELCEKYDALVARDALFKLLHKKKIDLIDCDRDKYFRLLCDVRVSGFIDVKSYMLSKNYAVPYEGETKKPWICKRKMP
jgi:endonuclease YncB( thermonuclease family)